LFKYVVVVFGYTSGDELQSSSYETPVTANVFDCFTDGSFIELPPINNSSRFRLEVYAYNEPAYMASREAIESAGTNTAQLATTTPTWTTQCTAVQQQDVQTLALCDPLAPGLVGLGKPVASTQITLGTSTFHLPDGRLATCGAASDAGADGDADAGADGAADAAVDASQDASTDSGRDAEAGAPVEAGPPIRFTTVRVRARVGPRPIGPTVDVQCPNGYTADVPAEPARYDIDVALLDEAGHPVGQTVCSATASVGAVTSAVCP
jgi:hypothetical protein